VHEVALVMHTRRQVTVAVAAWRDVEPGLAEGTPGPGYPERPRGLPEDLEIIRVELDGQVEDFDGFIRRGQGVIGKYALSDRCPG
jgi:hypothetical protein